MYVVCVVCVCCVRCVRCVCVCVERTIRRLLSLKNVAMFSCFPPALASIPAAAEPLKHRKHTVRETACVWRESGGEREGEGGVEWSSISLDRSFSTPSLHFPLCSRLHRWRRQSQAASGEGEAASGLRLTFLWPAPERGGNNAQQVEV